MILFVGVKKNWFGYVLGNNTQEIIVRLEQKKVEIIEFSKVCKITFSCSLTHI